MSIHTLPWPTGAITINDSNKFGNSAEQGARMFRAMMGSTGNYGIITPGNGLNKLAVTNLGGNQLQVDTGEAFIYGRYFHSDATELVNLTPVAATAGGLVVAEINWVGANQFSGRFVAKQSASGDPTIPSENQADLVQWQMPLYSYLLNNTGNATLTDLRQYIPRLDTTAQLADDMVDDTKVGARVLTLTHRQGGSPTNWNTIGTTTYTPDTVRVQAGAAQTVSGFVNVTFPQAYPEEPLVFVQLTEWFGVPAFLNVTAISPTQFTVTSIDKDANTLTLVKFSWWAVGDA